MSKKFENFKIVKQKGDNILELDFCGVHYQFSEEDREFVINEKDSNIVVLFWSALNRIALQEGLEIRLDEWKKPSLNSAGFAVTITNPKTNVARTAVVGLNPRNTDEIGRDNVDSTAFNRAKIRAFCELYGLPSERFKINPDLKKVTSKSAINHQATDSADSNQEVATPPANDASSNGTQNSQNSTDFKMNSGKFAGKFISEIFTENVFDAIDYFTKLFAVNDYYRKNTKLLEAIKGIQITSITDDEEAIYQFDELKASIS